MEGNSAEVLHVERPQEQRSEFCLCHGPAGFQAFFLEAKPRSGTVQGAHKVLEIPTLAPGWIPAPLVLLYAAHRRCGFFGSIPVFRIGIIWGIQSPPGHCCAIPIVFCTFHEMNSVARKKQDCRFSFRLSDIWIKLERGGSIHPCVWGEDPGAIIFELARVQVGKHT